MRGNQHQLSEEDVAEGAAAFATARDAALASGATADEAQVAGAQARLEKLRERRAARLAENQ